MGTRNLTMVIQDQETKVAQYGQWDGYPEGQGVTVLTFLQEKSNIEKLKQILPKIRFENEKDTKERAEFCKSIGSEDGWMNREQSEIYHKRYPLDSRDLGGTILSKLLEHCDQPEIVLTNSENFAGDGLFCEWAYVVDLDINTLEVYNNSNRRMNPRDRFFHLNNQRNSYRPIKIVKSFSLNRLPDPEKFISECYKEKTQSKSQENDLER